MRALLACGLPLLLLITPAAGQPPAAPAPAAMIPDTKLVPLLRGGGLAIVWRHERTGVDRIDDDFTQPATNCAAQRTLSVAGIAGAAETGALIRQLRIPIGKVLAGPMCRTFDTARFAFGAQVTAEPLLLHIDEARGRTEQIAGAELRQVVEREIGGAANIVVVTHFSNILGAFGVGVQEGQAAIVGRGPDGKLRAIGTVFPSRWGQVLRDELLAERRK